MGEEKRREARGASEEEKEIVITENPSNANQEKIVKKLNEETRTRRKKTPILVGVVLFVILAVISTIFAIMNMSSNAIVQGVDINGIDVSGKTQEEAREQIEKIVEEKAKEDITLQYREYNTAITPEQIETNFDIEEALTTANSIGRSNNILVDNFAILKANLFKTHIQMNMKHNDEALTKMIQNIDGEIPGALKEPSYEISKKKLIITKGTDGIVVKEQQLKDTIVKAINEGLSKEAATIEIPVEHQQAKDIDLDQIYKEVYKEPKDAYIEEKPFKLHIEEQGLDFAISMDKAKKILEKDKKTYTIPLKIINPKIKTADLGDKLFKETLSKYTTIYDAGNASRGTNIQIAARTINGTIILPGETFSYNGVLGNTSKDKGYQLGGSYVNGKVVPAYGGGICQVSSTLYNAVLYANLQIVERYNHSYSVSYVPAGRDATVSYGGKDFKFKNSRTYPVKIVANAKNGVISVALKGIKEEKEYDIELTSTVLSTTPYATTYQENKDLKEGKQKVIQVGHEGKKSKAYKIVKYNGKTISKTLLSSDTYRPMNRIIEKGTKKDETKTKEKEDDTKIEKAAVTENED